MGTAPGVDLETRRRTEAAEKVTTWECGRGSQRPARRPCVDTSHPDVGWR